MVVAAAWSLASFVLFLPRLDHLWSLNHSLLLYAHSMAWSHNRNYLLTSDASGNIKYWSPSIAPVQSLDSHNNQAIHGLSFSPSDTKFVSAGDDSTVRIWDWASHREERILEGHGWDVKVGQLYSVCGGVQR